MPSKKHILQRLKEIEKSIEVLKEDISEHYEESCFFNKETGLDKKEKEIYWEGFENGKKNSLEHNINLMKLQLKA